MLVGSRTLKDVSFLKIKLGQIVYHPKKDLLCIVISLSLAIGHPDALIMIQVDLYCEDSTIKLFPYFILDSYILLDKVATEQDLDNLPEFFARIRITL